MSAAKANTTRQLTDSQLNSIINEEPGWVQGNINDTPETAVPPPRLSSPEKRDPQGIFGVQRAKGTKRNSTIMSNGGVSASHFELSALPAAMDTTQLPVARATTLPIMSRPSNGFTAAPPIIETADISQIEAPKDQESHFFNSGIDDQPAFDEEEEQLVEVAVHEISAKTRKTRVLDFPEQPKFINTQRMIAHGDTKQQSTNAVDQCLTLFSSK